MSTIQRVLEFTTPAAKECDLRVTSVRGRETISRCFRFDIELVAHRSAPVLDPAKVTGTAGTLRIHHRDAGGQATSSCIHGLVGEFALRAAAGPSDDWTKYHLALVPRAWPLGLGRRSRVFVDLSVVDVVRKVLEDGKVPAGEIEFRCNGAYPQRDYIVQYQESDLAFITRLMDHAGLFWFFAHAEDGTRMVIADHPQAFTPIAGEQTLELQPQAEGAGAAGDWFQEERVTAFAHHQRVVPGEVAVDDWNWRTPSTPLAAKAAVSDQGVGNDTFEWGPHYQEKKDGDAAAKQRAEELRCRQRSFRGGGQGRAFRAGALFTLARGSGVQEEYLLVDVEHEASQAFDRGSGNPGVRSYRNRFTAIPSGVPFRAERHADRPVVPGLINARVDAGGDGKYADLDENGCYAVRLPFDRDGHADGKASRRVRMAQPYAGADHGIHFPLHKGAEVLLAHVNGDPDRPIIAGAVANPETPSPVTAENQTQAVIRTAGKNELRIEDKEGAEKVHLTATKDHQVTVGNDQDVTVGNDATTKISGNASTTIEGTKSELVTLASEERVGLAKTETIGGAYQISVGGAMNESVAGAKAEEVIGYKHETVMKNRKLSVGEDFEVTVAGSQHDQADEDRDIKAKRISIQAEESLQIVVGKAKITMKKNGDIVIEGANISVKGSGNVTVKGQKIAEN